MARGIPGSRGVCSTDGCDRPHKARGWCRKHYSEWQYENLTKPEPPDRQPFHLSADEAAWLAGLFDGEGCISDHGETSIRLTIKMTDKDILDRVAALTTGGVLPEKRRPHQRKQIWYWSVSWRPDVEELLHAMLPWFGERRSKRAREALARLSTQTRTPHVRVGGVV